MKKIIVSAFLCLNIVVASAATIDVSSDTAKDLWKSVDVIGKIENTPIIQTNNNKASFYIDSVSCVFEDYDACSFFAKINQERKLVIAMDGSLKFMQALVDSGVEMSEESPRLDVKTVACEKENEIVNCTIEVE